MYFPASRTCSSRLSRSGERPMACSESLAVAVMIQGNCTRRRRFLFRVRRGQSYVGISCGILNGNRDLLSQGCKGGFQLLDPHPARKIQKAPYLILGNPDAPRELGLGHSGRPPREIQFGFDSLAGRQPDQAVFWAAEPAGLRQFLAGSDVLLNQGGQEVGRHSTTVFFIIPLGNAPAKIGKLNHEPAIRIRFELCKLLHGVYDRKSTRLNSSHLVISYAVFCLKKKKNT